MTAALHALMENVRVAARIFAKTVVELSANVTVVVRTAGPAIQTDTVSIAPRAIWASESVMILYVNVMVNYTIRIHLWMSAPHAPIQQRAAGMTGRM